MAAELTKLDEQLERKEKQIPKAHERLADKISQLILKIFVAGTLFVGFMRLVGR